MNSSYDDVISNVDYTLTNEIETLQHQWKKSVDHKGVFVWKETTFGHILWENLEEYINISADPHLWTYINTHARACVCVCASFKSRCSFI